MTAMAMGGKGSGRKPSNADAKLLRDLRKAQQDQPPKRVVNSWKKTVRDAVKKQGK